MTFDYEIYLRACFSRHLSGILFFIVFCIALGRIICALVTRPVSKPVKAALVDFFTLAVCMLTLTVSKTFQVVADIGLPLLQEKDARSAVLTGPLEDVCAQTRTQTACRFSYDGHTVYGTWLTINGEEYFAVTAGSYAPGDTVTIEYLPRSRVVLSISASDARPGKMPIARAVPPVEKEISGRVLPFSSV